jgi:prephenate dehydratase
MRVGFQGEPGAFSEAAAMQLLGDSITTVPRRTFGSAFQAIVEGAVDAILVPVENSLAGSIVRVYDLLVESDLTIAQETILPIEHHLIGCTGATIDDIRAVSSHPMALAQCEHFFAAHPHLERIAAEDTAGSVREVLERGDKSHAAIAARRAADYYHGTILQEGIQDDAENYTRFVLLVPAENAKQFVFADARKMSLALRLAHKPGSLLAALRAFAMHGANLLKIESRPIHGRPWEYLFFIDLEADTPEKLDAALEEVRPASGEVRVLGRYAPYAHKA